MKEHKYDKTAKQCRERFQNHLNPQLNHVKFNIMENQKLIKIFGDIGNKWKEIASHFPGRVDNTIKNQFFSLVRKGFRNANKQLSFSYLDKINSYKPKVLAEFVQKTLLISIPEELNRGKGPY